ncbi:MAG: helix-turn-helix domain-containing protein [Kiritimatiellae bacterium]|nr:helix-turn-helix domain-containing protein [Kiritimatiellia bacterium]
MSNIAKVLKDEISRIARKEARQIMAPLRKPATGARHAVAELKRRLALLEQQNKRMAAMLAKAPAPASSDEAPKTTRNWISGKGVRSLRLKLGLPQESFAKLVGVGHNTVYKWESKPGMLQLRKATKAALLAVRGLTPGEARAKLTKKPTRRT